MSKTTKERVTAAQAGEELNMRHTGKMTVLPACDEKHEGHWHCATHDESFPNQFQKDSHIYTGTHKLVWMCHKHGAEQP